MKIRKLLLHIAVMILSLILLLGYPAVKTGAFERLFFDKAADAVSSASVILEQPNGEYVILINREMHPDEEKLSGWKVFFSGEEITYIFEDISCSVASADLGAVKLAESFQSRLPENQMKVYKEDTALLLSRIDQKQYDIVILSREFAEQNMNEEEYSQSAEQIMYSNKGEE